MSKSSIEDKVTEVKKLFSEGPLKIGDSVEISDLSKNQIILFKPYFVGDDKYRLRSVANTDLNGRDDYILHITYVGDEGNA